MNYKNSYNKDYYENGLIKGISGYQNYRWIPELTIPMAYHLIQNLPISNNQRILDYGCAKGYLVKALRLLGFDAYGVDVSEYAIDNVDSDIRKFCSLIKKTSKKNLLYQGYDWMIAKDVFEHIPENELSDLLKSINNIHKIFVAIPLADDDVTGKYIISEYDKDITHVIAKTHLWWKAFFENNGWKISFFDFKFHGIKENWTEISEKGNGFYILSK